LISIGGERQIASELRRVQPRVALRRYV